MPNFDAHRKRMKPTIPLKMSEILLSFMYTLTNIPN